MKRVILLTLSACTMGVALWAAPATNAKKPFIEDGVKPRVLSDYVEQDKDYWAYIRKNHPLYKYEKEGRMVGKLTESNRQEEFININNGPKAAKELGLEHIFGKRPWLSRSQEIMEDEQPKIDDAVKDMPEVQAAIKEHEEAQKASKEEAEENTSEKAPVKVSEEAEEKVSEKTSDDTLKKTSEKTSENEKNNE